MEYLKIDGEFPRLSGSAVTLGKFDGIHRGHRKLVERILEQKEKGLQTVLPGNRKPDDLYKRRTMQDPRGCRCGYSDRMPAGCQDPPHESRYFY